MSFLAKVFGDESSKVLKRLSGAVSEINALEEKYKAMDNDAIKSEMQSHREKAADKAYLDGILPDVFAMVREASRRTSGKRHFDVQLLGGMVLHEGNIAEMRTGEGKTLVATLAVALNALVGRGVHIVTVNDYLARRDAIWMGEIYHFLGFSIGIINHDASFLYDPSIKQGSEEDKMRDDLGSFKIVDEFLRPCSRQEAYGADITYGTNNEYGFDWLRDNLELDKENIRQRDHYFAIVDEVDSILIDEARTPLIISSPDEEAEGLYRTFARIAPQLKREEDFTVDEKMRAVMVNDSGISKVEKILGVDDIYTEKGVQFVRHLEQSLRAENLFQKDRHYVVKNGEVVIVDEFTGRMMPGRRWSDGLHQAIEAKEGLSIQKESRTLATITFQNYFRMYEKLSGMTGTAKTSEEEFQKVYDLNVVVVPTNKPMIRKDGGDKVFQTEKGKYIAVAREVKARHERGQPVLLGTASIEKNERVSLELKKEGIPHSVLNAKNNEREADIIAQAGRPGAVTVATNIAGRGVDILLGGNPQTDEAARRVLDLGGLFVLGTERHEARRIDNQLRGRAGRQGDPGESMFFLSLEDDLLRIFAPDRIKNLMGKLGIPEDEPIEAKLVSRSIEQAQEKIEGLHFDSRKHLLEYDDVLSKQRTAIYKMRGDILFADFDKIEGYVSDVLKRFSENLAEGEPDAGEIKKIVHSLIHKEKDEQKIEIPDEGRAEYILKLLKSEIGLRAKESREQFLQNARILYLQLIDFQWRDHLEVMEYTRSSVGLRAYGQRDPLVEYKNEAIRLFKTFHSNLENLFINNVFKIGIGNLQAGVARAVTNESKRVAEKILKNADGKKVGRNDPCPCGSGKKYKKCGMESTGEHQKNIRGRK